MHTETIEETIEVLPVKLAIAVNSPVGIVVTSLALYGAKALTFDARDKLTKMRDNRKARKAAEKLVAPPQQ